MDKQPDYIGLWITPYHKKSFFFLHITKRDKENISGIIEDTFGNATFEGKITENKIYFKKKYNSSRTLNKQRNYIDFVPHQQIRYLGKRKNNHFKGRYKIDEIGWVKRNAGKFILEEYVNSEIINLILKELREDNNEYFLTGCRKERPILK